jgi:putative protease
MSHAAPPPHSVPEILAPAGGRAQFFAALNAGADAVFLGLKAFNARSRAENFTVDDLRELVPLAHGYGMKVLVTVNVLIKEAELEDLIGTMADLEELGVDAAIVQDLGLARIGREFFPRLRLHASTQMAVHNLAGVLKARELGFRRVVLARELTAVEMKRIRAQAPRGEVELEAFCHGSLCYSYSGLCFFSGAEDARSGNRGECAYTCRQPYKILNEPGHGFLFSMRDLDTSNSVELLVQGGVDTLKIEGRKKDAQYVASTVRLYRQRLDAHFGRATLRPEAPEAASALAAAADPAAIERDLALSFQRQTTAFFLKGRYRENVIDLDNPTHFGVRIGAVEAVRGRFVAVRTEAPLERFDGLRISSEARVHHSVPQHGASGGAGSGDTRGMRDKYENRRLEFSLRELRLGGKRVFAAQAGERLELEVPQGERVPAVGDVVHKIRSADLKRRVEELADAPKDAKLKPWTELDRIDVAVEAGRDADASGEVLVIVARAVKLDQVVATATLRVPARRATGNADLARDAAAHLSVIGDASGVSYRAAAFAYEGDTSWFVPRSQLKELKAALAAELAVGYSAAMSARRARAVQALCPPLAARGVADSAPAVAADAARYAVKVDRLETLEDVLAVARESGLFVDEIVFEPKRAFLPERGQWTPAALAARLVELTSAAGVALRLAVPTVVRGWDEPVLEQWFRAAHERGVRRYEVGNVGALRLLEDWGLCGDGVDLASDFTLYALNSVTSAFWREQGIARRTLSIEDDLANVEAHVARVAPEQRSELQAIVFKDTPLFIAEACSLTALHGGCPTSAVCGYRTLEIENQKGERFYVAHESCKSIVYGREAYSVAHRQDALRALGLSRFRVDFLTRAYDRAAVGAVLGAVARGERVGATHPANFDRTLL